MKLLLPNVPEASRPDALSPLEEGLRGPGAAQLRAQTQAQLKDLEHWTRCGLSAGSGQQRYRELAALLDACLAAQRVIEQCPLPGAVSASIPDPAIARNFSHSTLKRNPL